MSCEFVHTYQSSKPDPHENVLEMEGEGPISHTTSTINAYGKKFNITTCQGTNAMLSWRQMVFPVCVIKSACIASVVSWNSNFTGVLDSWPIVQEAIFNIICQTALICLMYTVWVTSYDAVIFRIAHSAFYMSKGPGHCNHVFSPNSLEIEPQYWNIILHSSPPPLHTHTMSTCTYSISTA